MSSKYIFLMGAILLSWKGITRNHHSIDQKTIIAVVDKPNPEPPIKKPPKPPKKPA